MNYNNGMKQDGKTLVANIGICMDAILLYFRLFSFPAICALVQPWEGFVIGFVGSFIANGSVALLNKLKVDDPVGKSKRHLEVG